MTRFTKALPGSLSLYALLAGSAMAGTYQQTDTGITVTPDSGPARHVQLDVFTDKIIHVQALDRPDRPQIDSLITVARPEKVSFAVAQAPCLARAGSCVTVRTAVVSAEVSLITGVITFRDAAGKVVLAEKDRGRITPVVVDDGFPVVAIQQSFNPNTTEALYGLGQHQNAQVNLNGEDVLLMQHNMDVAVPFLVSDRNYGILWDNYSITRFGNPKPYGHMGRDLILTDEKGRTGGLTARYYVDGVLKLTRFEKAVDYQFLSDLEKNWPASLKGAQNVRVVWEGTIASDKAGQHKFRLFSSGYARLFIDGVMVQDRWRQNWNPWYHNFTVDFKPQGTKAETRAFRLEWEGQGGHVAVLHNDPLPPEQHHAITFDSEAGDAIDYYFVKGDSIDDVIAGYRHLTGEAPMMPKWSYGFWQSRQRYKTDQELLDVLKTYRERKIPIDNMVQDWSYWPVDGWGSHDFDATRFPDPSAFVAEVHKNNAQIMISIWGKFYSNTDNYKLLDSRGYMFRRNVEKGDKDFIGYLNSHFSPYTQEARDLYWASIRDKIAVHGFDAWWVDNTEPDIHSNLDPVEFKKRLTVPKGSPAYRYNPTTYFNTYALMITQAVVEGERAKNPEKRPFILTRSGFAGIQRNSAAVWSGDTVARWDDLYEQIGAGIGMGLSGVPNWTHDIGGYAQEYRYQGENVKAEDLAEWRELNLRWFQFGALSPLFRSHGEVVYREIFNLAPDGSDVQESLIWYNKLRYRLMPYIYSTAAESHHRSGTIMRGLVMDFPHDATAKSVNDQYMFGHSLLVAPVYKHMARSREVYLPSDSLWYDLYTGQRYTGGQRITARAPLTRMPVYVKAGSILPLGPVIQYVDEKPDAPLYLNVYTGADGTFSLYEDDGVSTAYLRGEFSRIAFTYDDRTGVLRIADRQGSYAGMVAIRQIHVRFITPGLSTTEEFETSDHSLVYDGKAMTVTRKP